MHSDNNNKARVHFALSFGASGDIESTQTLPKDTTNLTMCYKFATEHFQHYPNTKLDLRFISQVDSFTGPSNWAVVDVPEHFKFRGYGITPFADTAYWVEKDQPCTVDSSLRAKIKESADGIVTVGKDGNATFTFTTANSGNDLHLCYKFNTEKFYRVDNHTTSVTQLHEIEQSHGDLGVSVADYPKGYMFVGEYLAGGDKFKWGIDGDCNAPAAEIHQNGNINDTLTLINTKEYVSHPTRYNTTMNTTFTMRPSASGKNLTVCYKHRAEPWTVYAMFTNDVRMVHNISAAIGDWNRSISDQVRVCEERSLGNVSLHLILVASPPLTTAQDLVFSRAWAREQ